MTEAEWLTSADPAAMLEHVADERKLRLFACACCGSAWELVTEERCRPAVPARPMVSTATTSTWWPSPAAPSASPWTTRSMPPERGQ